MASWNIIDTGSGNYAVAYTHYTYLKYIAENYSKIYLVSSVKGTSDNESSEAKYFTEDLGNITVIPLPAVKSYLKAQFNTGKYYRAIKLIAKKTDVIYCRVPDPFSWMPALTTRKKTIMHFVGDTIDATVHNEKWSFLKKAAMITGYLPDYLLTLLAARKSKVYTNGAHLSRKLKRYGISATPVISSTVSESSLIAPSPREKTNSGLKLIYVGYIRYAKGIKLLMDLFLVLKKRYPDFTFHIIGDGEMAAELRNFIETNSLSPNVILHGHIDDRDRINGLLRDADLFIFPSLSEGSPRVVIEAMSQGVAVVSTPVGSLPTTFEDPKEIRFFDYNDTPGVTAIIDEYVRDPKPFENQRYQAFNKIKNNYTIESFLSKIFHYET